MDYEHFSKHYKLITRNLSKQIELENPDLKQQINVIGRLEKHNGATVFFTIEKPEETTSEFSKNAVPVVWFNLVTNYIYKIKTQKIVNLLNVTESSKFETRKWYVFIDQNNTKYGEGNENDSTIKFETKVIKSSFCSYSDVKLYLKLCSI